MRSVGILLLTVLLTAATVGQADGQMRLRGGYDLTNFFGDGISSDNRGELGFGGSFGLFNIGPVFISAEGYYRQKGAKNVAEFNQQVFTEGTAEVGIDYVEVPILARVNLPTLGNRVVPYLNAGPAFAWRIDCGITFDAGSQSAEQKCEDLEEANIEQTLRDYEQGIVLGGGLDFAVSGGSGAINLDARVTQGLSRINENADGSVDVKNRVFSVMLGYSFGIPGGLEIPGSRSTPPLPVGPSVPQ